MTTNDGRPSENERESAHERTNEEKNEFIGFDERFKHAEEDESARARRSSEVASERARTENEEEEGERGGDASRRRVDEDEDGGRGNIQGDAAVGMAKDFLRSPALRFASLLPQEARRANVPTTMIDEAERKLRRPQVTASEVFRLLVAHYDIGDISRESMKELPSYDDKNWYFFTYGPDPQSGEKIIKNEYVVKIHNGVDSSGITRGVLFAQERVMAQLGAHGIDCPRIVKSTLTYYYLPGQEGTGTMNAVTADTPGAQRDFCTRVTFLATNQIAHTLQVITFLRGKLLVDIPLPHTDAFVRQSGIFVGRICHVLGKWPTPQEVACASNLPDLHEHLSMKHMEQQGMNWKALESRARLWDLRYFMDVQHFMKDLIVRGVFQDEMRISMCNTVFNAFKHLVMPVSEQLRIGIIHNDLNEQNLMVLNDAKHAKKFGVIDFGDVVVSWRVNEVAIAMAYCTLNKRDPIRDMSVMLSGIQSVYPLTPVEMRVLPCLIAARLVTSLVMGMYSYHMQIVGEVPRGTKTVVDGGKVTSGASAGNAYVLSTQKSGWTALSRILATGAESMFKRFITDGFAEPA